MLNVANIWLLTLEKNCCYNLLNAVVAVVDVLDVVVVVGAERG